MVVQRVFNGNTDLKQQHYPNNLLSTKLGIYPDIKSQQNRQNREQINVHFVMRNIQKPVYQVYFITQFPVMKKSGDFDKRNLLDVNTIEINEI